jgi:membrane protease YdiL (CAAX protease family)
MRSLARRIPTPFWAALLALALTMLAGGVWSGLLVANLRTTPTIPWAVVVTGLLLWLMWQYLGGRWWPRSTSETRRHLLRARPVAASVFAWALVAGGLSIISLSGCWIVLFQLVEVHGNPLPDFSQYPILTVALVVGMGSLVAAAAEEVGFRGYFQGALEERIGGPLAILIAALAMEPGHGTTQGFAWPTMLFYLLVDVMFGTAAYLTKSILPGLCIHTIGLIIFFSLVWPNDPTRRLVRTSGPDTWFWIHVAQATFFAVLAILVFKHLGSLAGKKGAELLSHSPEGLRDVTRRPP